MSTKHVRNAADLVRFGCSLKVECTACGAAHTLTGAEVHRLHGSASLDLLLPRLRCASCRARGARLILLPPVYSAFSIGHISISRSDKQDRHADDLPSASGIPNSCALMV
jgi:hypothetical protein